jgi:hydrogenase/urease accessory protein HupE
MKARRFLLAIFFWCLAIPAFAHRLDEYLQATTISVQSNRVVLELRLTPGVSVAQQVVASIDANGDGTLSQDEQRTYAERVNRDASLAVDGTKVPLRITSFAFPTVDAMNNGLGEIDLTLAADLPPGGSARTLTFENHHERAVAAYLVNCLVPRDPGLHITGQERNYDQSTYQVDFAWGNAPQTAQVTPARSGLRQWLEQTGYLAVLESYVFHGVHHILTGYDHLLFVSALVLAATTLWDLVKVVTAFTLAHTITLTLAALNFVHLPGRVVEPFISASIVFVALQNVFCPGQARGWSRLAVAFFFGLFHGLGFAGGLLEAMREMPGATLTLALLGFSLGVEAGHQVVVLPLFAFLKAARRSKADVAVRPPPAPAFQRVGSAMISVCGVYYLCLALTRPS